MALLVLAGGVSKTHAPRRFGVSAKIVARRVERRQAEGLAGMANLPSACQAGHRSGPPQPSEASSRRLRWIASRHQVYGYTA
jgi:transposase